MRTFYVTKFNVIIIAKIPIIKQCEISVETNFKIPRGRVSRVVSVYFWARFW